MYVAVQQNRNDNIAQLPKNANISKKLNMFVIYTLNWRHFLLYICIAQKYKKRANISIYVGFCSLAYI